MQLSIKEPKSAMISVRLKSSLKKKVEKVFEEVGLTHSSAILLFYKNIDIYHGLPFDINTPNAETRKVIEDTRAGKHVTRSTLSEFNKMVDDMIADA